MKKNNTLGLLVISGLMIFACETKKEGTTQQANDSLSTASAETTSVIYNVDTASSIVKWKGSKMIGDSHNGTIKVQNGQLQVAGNQLMGGTVVIDMTSIKNEDLTDKKKNDKLIGHLKSDDFFGVDKNPTSVIVIDKVVAGTDGKMMVTGTVTMKGKTNQITFPVDIHLMDGQLHATGKLMLDRSKFDVKYGSGKFFENLGDKMINDQIEFEFHVKANK